MTGWNMPPGCTGNESYFHDGGPCACCGRDPAECICPECPDCGEHGNPRCYEEHTLAEFSVQQLIGQARVRISWIRDQLAEEEMALQMLEARERKGDTP